MSAVQEKSEVKMLHGDRSDVLKQLEKTHAEKLLVVEALHCESAEFERLADNIGHFTKAMRELLLEPIDQKLIHQMVESFAQTPVAVPHLMREAGMEIRARKAVINSGEWLSAAQVSELAGFRSRNVSAQPNKWKNHGRIFAIHHNGSDYYPGFGLDPDDRYRPYKALADIIAIFKDKKDAWGIAFWFQSGNGWLGGLKPQELLKSDPDRVREAARKEVEEVMHG